MTQIKFEFLAYLLWIFYFYSVNGITLPPEIKETALYSDVTTSRSCQSNDVAFNCSSRCQTRTTFPSFETPLKIKNDACKNVTVTDIGIELPNANITNDNGYGVTVNCTSITASNNAGNAGVFTLSLWVKNSCRINCTLFTIGSNFTVQSDLIVEAVWTHVAVQYNGDISIFVSGKPVQSFYDTDVFSEGHNVTFGTKSGLAAGDSIDFVDARWYADVLTDREILSLATGSFANVATNTECRCPPYAPSLVETNPPHPRRHLLCTNRISTMMVPRLGTDAHPAVYMVDGDSSTYWNSGSVTYVTLTLQIGQLYQISRIILEGMQNIPDSIDLVLKRGSKTTFTNVKLNTAAFIRNGNIFDFNVTDALPVSTRAEYERLLADRIELTLNSDGGNTFYTVSEFKLVTRCACYGNDDNCINSGSGYACACTGNTTGDHCNVCIDEYYRQEGDFNCRHRCACNSSGARNSSCGEVGGQCICKSNVVDTSRTCSECKPNTVRLGSDLDNGCTPCLCNPAGIVYCADNSTCVCKENVESVSGQCTECRDDHFGIDQATGCTACKCGTGTTQSGGAIQSCNKATGQCPCKSNVQGRQCEECKPSFWNLTPVWPHGCTSCGCSFVGSENKNCNATGHCPCHGNVSVNRDCKPAELKMEPKFGPVAGGTRVTITGYNLGNSNTTVNINIGTARQSIVKRSRDSIIFTTHASDDVATSNVVVVWYEGDLVYKDDVFEEATTFRYKTNPDISVPETSFTTFASGGCSIDITGDNLSNIPHPAIIVHMADGTVLSDVCVHSSNTRIMCPTPDVTHYLTNGSVSFGIRLDNIRDYENFTAISLVVVPDPEIETNQTVSFRNTFDKEIIIKGRRLDVACLNSDIKIQVGSQQCDILSRSATIIRCDPRETFPGSSREEDVKVVIGGKEVYWGKVTFTEFWKLNEFIYICVGAGGFILLMVVMVCVCCCCRRRRRKHKKQTFRGSQLELVETPPGRAPSQYLGAQGHTNPVAFVSPIMPGSPRTPLEINEDFLLRLQANVSKMVSSSIVDSTHVVPGRICTHKGKKIRVINGQFGEGATPVAVTIKTLTTPYPEAGSLPTWLNDGLRECIRLRDSLHENVIRLMGIAVDNRHVFIIYPEMKRRTLKDYIENSSTLFMANDRLSFCVQVGQGMKFLDSEKIVHKDLAARNCWVDEGGAIKIADASFAHDLYPDDYIYQHGRHQPVRWMAPESLKQSGFYHSKSDVWSFGVLMWEVFTNGYMPYHDIENISDVADYVTEKGYRLGRPHGCSDKIFSVIELCHTDISEDRPNFVLIVNHLTKIIRPGRIAPATPVPSGNNSSAEDTSSYVNIGAIKLPPLPPRPKKIPPITSPRPVPPRPHPKPRRQKVE